MKLLVKNVKILFSNLYEAKASKENQTPKFDITAICSAETSVKLLGAENKGKPEVTHDLIGSQICPQVILDKFKKAVKAKNWAYNKADGSGTREPYTYLDEESGEEKYYKGVDADTFIISAKKGPKQINRTEFNDAGQLLLLNQARRPAEPGAIANGDLVNLVIDIYAMEGDEFGKIIAASLDGVQLVKAGERHFDNVDVGGAFEELEAVDVFDEDEI